MSVDFYGRTEYTPQDNSGAIQRRLSMIDDMGNQQNEFSASQAARAKSARDAAITQKLQQAQSDAVNQGQQNLNDMQNYQGNTGGVGGAGGAGNSFESFKSAISRQESGNNYGAINKMSGAMGKYQIMPNNLGGTHSGWDWEALGRDVTSSEFIKSPQLQEKVADHFLKAYYDKYGPAGAAVAWYAGPNAAANYQRSGAAGTNGQAGGHPSVSSYIQDILKKMGL